MDPAQLLAVRPTSLLEARRSLGQLREPSSVPLRGTGDPAGEVLPPGSGLGSRRIRPSLALGQLGERSGDLGQRSPRCLGPLGVRCHLHPKAHQLLTVGLGGALQSLQPLLELPGPLLAGGPLCLGMGRLASRRLLVTVHPAQRLVERFDIADQLADPLAVPGELLRGLVEVLLQRRADQLLLVVVLL